jgi:hypothetical protein
MAIRKKKRKKPAMLPEMLRPLFWDYHFWKLSWERDRDLVTARVLAEGDWDAVKWLRKRLGDEALRAWIERRRGAGLTRQQVRFWELMFGIPHRQVSEWLAQESRKVWDNR